jgi:enediyne biosynthesis protein E4
MTGNVKETTVTLRERFRSLIPGMTALAVLAVLFFGAQAAVAVGGAGQGAAPFEFVPLPIAIDDVTGHGPADGRCTADTRTDEVFVSHPPTAPAADGFTSFALNPEPAPPRPCSR